MDLFFYREPEEPKKAENDEIAAIEYPLADYSAAAGDWGAAPADLPWTEAAVPVAGSVSSHH